MTKVARGTLLFAEIHSRYGTRVARRVEKQLALAELADIALENFPSFLEARAVLAQKQFQSRFDRPGFEADGSRAEDVKSLYRRWQEAEALAFIIATAEESRLGPVSK